MPELVLENVPQPLYDELSHAAEANHRSVADEAVERLRWLQRRCLPDELFLSEQISAPCTIPLPGPGKPVKTRQGGLHLPDPPRIISLLE